MFVFMCFSIIYKYNTWKYYLSCIILGILIIFVNSNLYIFFLYVNLVFKAFSIWDVYLLCKLIILNS